MKINIYNKEEIDKIRASARITANALNLVEEKIKPGMTTLEVDHLVEDFILKNGGKPAFKGYHGFSGTVCASVNEEIVHGIPSNRVLEEGDIISVDTGTILDGFCSDSSRTFAIGNISTEALDLLNVTKKALAVGIEEFFEGNRLYTLSNRIQVCIEEKGYGVVKDYVGHGIGYNLHEDPPVPNYGVSGTGLKFKVGMVLAIEPMANLGSAETEVLEDGWTVVTKDRKYSAHFEHTVALTDNGQEILTHG